MPSKSILEQKQKTVSELADKMRNAASGVLVNYQGLTVEDDTKCVPHSAPPALITW